MNCSLRSRRFVTLASFPVMAATLFPADVCLAARPRRPSAAQIKKMKEQMEYAQAEMQRFQRETAAVQQRIFTQFDENGNGKLEGAEKAKYNKYMAAVQKGKEPNPFAEVTPIGQGPKPTAKK